MGKFIRILFSIVLVAAIVLAVLVLGPQLLHTCDNCAEFFVGTGYSANLVSNTITDLSGQDSKILCNNCAAKEHALAIAAGKSLKDYQLPLVLELPFELPAAQTPEK